MTLRFLGQEFESLADLQKAYPKYGTPDTVPFIRAGASTPHEVEVAAWLKRNRRKVKPKLSPLRVKKQPSVARKLARRKAA